MRYLLVLLLFGFFSQILLAQESEIWSLSECIEYGLENNLDVRDGVLSLESSELDYRQARYSRYPNLNANTNYQNSWGRSIDPTSNDFISIESRFLTAGASSSVILYNGFRIQNSIKQADIYRDATQLDLESRKDQVILNIVTAYMNVIFNKELYENALAQLNSTRTQVDRTTKQVNAGALPVSNLLELQAQEATNELNVINQENALNLSYLQLKQYLQLPAERSIEIEIPQIDMESVQSENVSLNDIYNNALNNLPGVQSAKKSVEGAEVGVKVAEGNLYPRLSLSGGLNSNYSSFADRRRFVSDGGPPIETYPIIGLVEAAGTPTGEQVRSLIPFTELSGEYVDGYNVPDQFKDNLSKSLSLNLSIPIFNGYSAQLGVQRSKITKDRSQIILEQTRNMIRQSIETAYYDVIAASKSYTAAEKQVNAREESFRMTEQRYNLGAADFTEYQIAENDLFQARSDLLRSKYDLIYKLKILDFYQGKPLEF